MDWYVVQSKPWEESRVEARLAHHGIEAFLPRIESARRRRAVRLEPLFPGYLFARFAPASGTWNTVRWTPGVRRVLGAGGEPVPVPPEVIETIQARIGDGGYVRVGIPFEPGARVRVLDGSLAGLRGIFERPTSRAGRVRVLLDILGAPLEIDWCLLEAE